MRDYSEWYLTSNDTPKIIEKIREIKAFEDFHRGKPEDDPEEDFETIRRNMREGGMVVEDMTTMIEV